MAAVPPVEAAERLRLSEIFLSLQGEARSVGWPTVFVRLTGCPLRCQYCDTAYAFHGGQWWEIDAILAGRFSDGDSVPSVRALAAEEGANPLTVAKAYQGFQDEGLIVVKRGVGMFVAPGARTRLRESERAVFVREEWPLIRERMKRLGLDADELLKAERA